MMIKNENNIEQVTPKQLIDKVNLYLNRIERTGSDVERIESEIGELEKELTVIISSGDFTNSKEKKEEIKAKKEMLEDTSNYLRILQEGKSSTGYEELVVLSAKSTKKTLAEIQSKIDDQEELILIAKGNYISRLKELNKLRGEAVEAYAEHRTAYYTVASLMGADKLKDKTSLEVFRVDEMHGEIIKDDTYKKGVIFGVLGIHHDEQNYYITGDTNYNIDKMIGMNIINTDGITKTK